MMGLLKDFALGLRRLRKSSSFTVVAVATLALGIGANTAIFSLADLIIRRPVALPEMDHLQLWMSRPRAAKTGELHRQITSIYAWPARALNNCLRTNTGARAIVIRDNLKNSTASGSLQISSRLWA